MAKGCVLPYFKPVFSRIKNQITSSMEGLSAFNLGYLYREYGSDQGDGWDILTASPGHFLHSESKRMQFMQSVIERAQEVILSTEVHVSANVDQNGDMVVVSTGYAKREPNGLPVTTLMLSTLFLRTMTARWLSLRHISGRQSTREYADKSSDFSHFWVGIEDINRIRFMVSPKVVSVNDTAFNVPIQPILISDCCDLYTRQPSLKIDDAFYSIMCRRTFH